jgi:CheY-like chemotaxis protein
VQDTGIGIPPAELERIFHPFAQADASTTRTFGGTGLGLTISANLVGLMGGRMWVESEVGNGSTFFFTARFPSAEEAPPRSKPALDVSAPPPVSLLVLVVEDNPANQKLAAYILQDRGHRVEIAADGQQALGMTGNASYDVILMDVQMPGMDGTEVTAAIRAREAGRRRVPIIAMTAHAMKRDRDRCMAAGMDGYLSKPINGQDLIEAVESSAGKATAAAETVLCLEEALARLDGRRELFQEMVAFFFRDSPAVLDGIRSGLQDGSATALDRHAHKLMGTLLYLGAEPALQAARRVETIGRLGNLTEAAEAVSHLERELSRLEEALAPYYPAGRQDDSDRRDAG